MTFADQFLHTRFGGSFEITLEQLAAEQEKKMREALEHFAEECTRQLFDCSGVSALHTAARVAKCECGSGSNEPSGAHSHWCGLWIAP